MRLLNLAILCFIANLAILKQRKNNSIEVIKQDNTEPYVETVLRLKRTSDAIIICAARSPEAKGQK